MFYRNGTNLYHVGDDGVAHPLELEAEDRVIEKRELGRIIPKVGEEAVRLPPGSCGVTIDEIVRSFGLSGDNPVRFDREAHERSLSDAPEQSAPPESPELAEEHPESPAQPEASEEGADPETSEASEEKGGLFNRSKRKKGGE